MPPAKQDCPDCGRSMNYRLGTWECPDCGHVVLVEVPDDAAGSDTSVETEAEEVSTAVPTDSTAAPRIRIDWAKGQVLGSEEFLPPPPAVETQASIAEQAGTTFAAGLAMADGQLLPLPPDGNTSGMGAGYPLPAEASGWTNASVIPGGLFSFYTGSWLWGILGAVGLVFGVAGIAYFVVVGLRGKEDAWRGRRFSSVAEYVAVMAAWNRAGLIIIWVSVRLLVIGAVFLIDLLNRSMALLELN